MPLVVYTHNGQSPAKGGKRIGYAYVGMGAFFPDSNVIAWMQAQQAAAAQQRQKKAQQTAVAMKEFNLLPRAANWRNCCPKCGDNMVHNECRTIGDVQKKVFVCLDCNITFRPYGS